MVGYLSDIETMGSADGPGVRLVLFLSGCNLRCLYCHNPETWNKNDFTRQITPEEVLSLYNKYKGYYGENGGITFSGGEPLCQSEFVKNTAKLLKQNGISIALDTAGAVENIDGELLNYIDLVILDIKAVDADEYKFITGINIELFNNFLEKCQQLGKKLWLRQVIVPGINDDEDHIILLKNFAKTIKNVERIELLPYHSMAKSKYDKLQVTYRLENVPDMDKEKLITLQKLLNK